MVEAAKEPLVDEATKTTEEGADKKLHLDEVTGEMVSKRYDILIKRE
jgi:hypothetical protein